MPSSSGSTSCSGRGSAARESSLIALTALVALGTSRDFDPGLKWIGGQGRTPGKHLPAYTRSEADMKLRDPSKELPGHLDARRRTARQALSAISGGPGVGARLAALGAQLGNRELRVPQNEPEILKLLREAKAVTAQVVRVHGGSVATWERLSHDSVCLALPHRQHRVVGTQSGEPSPINSSVAGERLAVALEALRTVGRLQLLTWEDLGLRESAGYTHPYTAVERALRALRTTQSPAGEDWSDLNQFLNVTTNMPPGCFVLTMQELA